MPLTIIISKKLLYDDGPKIRQKPHLLKNGGKFNMPAAAVIQGGETYFLCASLEIEE